MATLDGPTSGQVVIDRVDILGFQDKALTMLRRDRLGFVFQAYNLVPTLIARENTPSPLDIAGATLDIAWFDTVVDTLSFEIGSPCTGNALVARQSGGTSRASAMPRCSVMGVRFS